MQARGMLNGSYFGAAVIALAALLGAYMCSGRNELIAILTGWGVFMGMLIANHFFTITVLLDAAAQERSKN